MRAEHATKSSNSLSTDRPAFAPSQRPCQASRHHRKLKSFAELSQFRRRRETSAATTQSKVEVGESLRFRHLEALVEGAERNDPKPMSHGDRKGSDQAKIGWVAFILGPTSGFVSSFGTSVLSTTFQRASAWVFHDQTTLKQALDLALGLNGPRYEIRMLPAICGVVDGAKS